MPNVTETVIVGLVPAVVEAAKRAGLPVKYAGIAAILVATALVALSDLADANDSTGSLARWVLSGLVLGLAGAGLYSQAQRLPSVQPHRIDESD